LLENPGVDWQVIGVPVKIAKGSENEEDCKVRNGF